LKDLKQKSLTETGKKQNLPSTSATKKSEFLPIAPTDNTKLFRSQVRKLNIHNFMLERINKDIDVKTMGQLNRMNETRLRDEVSLLLLDLMNFFRVKNGMTADMIEDIVEMIIQEHSNLTLYDIGLCFREGKVGRYGKVYDRLDGGVIMEWCNKYQNKFIDACEEAHNQRKNEYTFGDGLRQSEKYDRYGFKKR